MLIYKITNKLNGKCYIGQTVNFIKRWERHCSNRDKTPVSMAIAKYGIENFSYHIEGEYTNEQTLNDAEDYFIEFYNCLAPNGYNRVTGQQKSRIWSEESLRKASESKRGNKNPRFGKTLSLETRKAISKANKGKPMSEITKAKLRTANLGKKASSIAKLNMSVAQKAKPRDVWFKKGRVATNKVALECSNGIIYASISEAANQLRIDRTTIFDVLKGLIKSAKGYIFKRIVNANT